VSAGCRPFILLRKSADFASTPSADSARFHPRWGQKWGQTHRVIRPAIRERHPRLKCGVRELGPTTQQAMVDAFVRAELNSPRFGPMFLESLRRRGGNLATLWEPEQVNLRCQMLGDVRGYQRDGALFRGFPSDTTWRTVENQTAFDWSALRYAQYPTWQTLSGGTRFVTDGAANIRTVRVVEHEKSINEGVLSLVEVLRAGASLPEIIAVEDADATGSLILLEGHTRATAYVCAGETTPVRVMVGTSSRMKLWWLY
jgi:hypothetical protein